MFDFIFSQPDENVVDFNESTTDSKCGCLMVQYGNLHFPKRFQRVGSQFWVKEHGYTPSGHPTEIILAKLERDFFYFTPTCAGVMSYKQLKEYIRAKYDAKPSPVPITTT